jgi:hypothetical protein
MFTGPGVIDATSANVAMEINRLIEHLLQFREISAHGTEHPAPRIEENCLRQLLQALRVLNRLRAI